MILKLLAGNIINRGRALFPTRCMAIIVPRVTKLLVPEQYHKKKTHTHTQRLKPCAGVTGLITTVYICQDRSLRTYTWIIEYYYCIKPKKILFCHTHRT